MKRYAAVLLVLLLLLTGCSEKKPTSTPSRPIAADSPTLTKDTVCDAIRWEIVRSSFDKSQAQYLTYLEDTAVYSAESLRISGNSATATVTVCAKDMYAVAIALEDTVGASAEELDALAVEMLSSAETVENTVEVSFRKQDGQWVPMMSEELVDALYGGLLTYQKEYTQKEESAQ